MLWQPIIKNDLEKYLEKIHSIFYELKKNEHNNYYGLFTGKLGIALFYYYYYVLFSNEESKRLCNDILNSAINNIKFFNEPSLSEGISGLSWIVHFLYNQKFVSSIDDDFSQIDEYIFKALKLKLSEKKYDLITGSIGYFLYFLERKRFKSVNKELAYFCNTIENIKSDKDNTCFWFDYYDDANPNINLGLAHGQISIAVALSKAAAIRDNGILIDKIINLYKSVELNNCANKSIFPTSLPHNKNVCSRLAWCYGDLGIGIGMMNIGFTQNMESVFEYGKSILLKSIDRKTLGINGVVDAGICHGSVGIAHIYNRAFQWTEIIDFKDIAIYWYNQTIELSNHQYGLVGYKTWFTSDYGGWKKDYSFLSGISGIGLSLIAGISDLEPRWDKILLIS